MNTKNTDVGVIVGRFQVHELHDSHKDLIDTVMQKHSRVIIFLGLSPLRCTTKNPLDFRSRKAMIHENLKYADVDIHYINDVPSDELWSKNLDAEIERHINPGQTVTLYGSRDSFIASYKGKFPTCELESNSFISGSEVRRQISTAYKPTKDYRAGVIASTAQRYPTVYTTVDVAIFKNHAFDEILLVRKPNETKWRLPGGFANPQSFSFEEDARREVMEEVGIETSDPVYLGSFSIDDWRYRSERDKIKTLLFTCVYSFGKPEGNDDVAEAKWFSTKDVIHNVVDEHKTLVTRAIHWASQK